MAALARKREEWAKFQANMVRVLNPAPEGTGA